MTKTILLDGMLSDPVAKNVWTLEAERPSPMSFEGAAVLEIWSTPVLDGTPAVVRFKEYLSPNMARDLAGMLTDCIVIERTPETTRTVFMGVLGLRYWRFAIDHELSIVNVFIFKELSTKEYIPPIFSTVLTFDEAQAAAAGISEFVLAMEETR